MLNDSVKMRDLDDRIRVVDLSTLVLESLPGSVTSTATGSRTQPA